MTKSITVDRERDLIFVRVESQFPHFVHIYSFTMDEAQRVTADILDHIQDYQIERHGL